MNKLNEYNNTFFDFIDSLDRTDEDTETGIEDKDYNDKTYIYDKDLGFQEDFRGPEVKQ